VPQYVHLAADAVLTTPVYDYRHPDTGRRITLVATVHIGTPDYYAILAELITRRETGGALVHCEGARLPSAADIQAARDYVATGARPGGVSWAPAGACRLPALLRRRSLDALVTSLTAQLGDRLDPDQAQLIAGHLAGGDTEEAADLLLATVQRRHTPLVPLERALLGHLAYQVRADGPGEAR